MIVPPPRGVDRDLTPESVAGLSRRPWPHPSPVIPPQTIVSVPVQPPVIHPPEGAQEVKIGCQESVTGSYQPPVRTGAVHPSPAQTIMVEPVHTRVCDNLAEGTLSRDVALQLPSFHGPVLEGPGVEGREMSPLDVAAPVPIMPCTRSNRQDYPSDKSCHGSAYGNVPRNNTPPAES